ncbi:2-hydroxyacid dehydrogenase [Paramicrobacterium agarici]|uniref:Phosphoglycerate dehydrogenase-like enzyme n=1 Tax=Paramicrobacterium agarici TaxID=630514 RepID=A0A2A9DSL4_9MICO|nr:2-hydroxyacid dehydrogenase [Microbacterium agarici]PFG29336.1 phosphoglycerate dehydrogenase-like enzyme [Microbacterium agarici]
MSQRLVVSTPGNALRTMVGEVPEGVEMIRWDMDGPAPVDHIDIAVGPYMGGPEPLAHLETVTTQLVQSQSIGYDGVTGYLPSGRVFANAASVHEASTAELAMALILAVQRGIPDFVRASSQGTWAPARYASLADRRVLIVGYGGIGVALEERLDGFEASVTRVARTARDSSAGRIHGFDELPALLPDAEIVVLAVPLNDETTYMVDAAFLAALPDDALVVNVARGAVIDTDAMLAEARTGRLRFGLDVTDPEPLPEGHELFTLDNVLISPHVGGASTAMLPRMAKLLRRQIDHALAGESFENVVIRP